MIHSSNCNDIYDNLEIVFVLYRTLYKFMKFKLIWLLKFMWGGEPYKKIFKNLIFLKTCKNALKI